MNDVRGQQMQIQNPRKLILRVALSAALVFLSILTPENMMAQATATRSRVADASAFVAYTRLSPDYGPSGNGVTIGGDYTRYFRFVSPALEVRFKTGTGASVGERTFGGGLRLEHQISYFHPYADFMISTGTITFAQKDYLGSNGTGSNGSVVYSYGGGVDYDFSDQWAVRVDFQGERWDLNETPDITLAPRALSIGVLYRIRLGRRRD
jgi:hypothetical protein